MMKRKLSLAILLILSACDLPATPQVGRPSSTLTPFAMSSTLEVLPGSTPLPTATDLLFHPLPTEAEALAHIRRFWPNAVIVDIKRMSEPEAQKIATAACDILLTRYDEVWVIAMDGAFSKRYRAYLSVTSGEQLCGELFDIGGNVTVTPPLRRTPVITQTE